MGGEQDFGSTVRQGELKELIKPSGFTSSNPTKMISSAFLLNSFSEFLGMEPDGVITSLLDAGGNTIPKAVKKLKRARL